MHKAILFDLGKVLIHFDFQRGYRALEGLCPYTAEEIPRRLAGTGLVERFETGLVEPRGFVEEMSRILDLRVDYERFSEIWSCIFTHELLPESMLEGLRRRYRLVLLSNTNALHFEMIRGTYSHLLRHFDVREIGHKAGGNSRLTLEPFYRVAEEHKQLARVEIQRFHFLHHIFVVHFGFLASLVACDYMDGTP